MENRRQTYRHPFEPKEVLRAELRRSEDDPVLACEVLDLSLGGARVRLRKQVGPLNVGDAFVIRLLGRGAPAPVQLNLSIPSQIVFVAQYDKEWHCGLRFLPSADVRVNDHVEQTLSRFLLAEQRRRKEAANRRSYTGHG
jgi:c-di-GMP-binding flagellar brake protein YcgR